MFPTHTRGRLTVLSLAVTLVVFARETDAQPSLPFLFDDGGGNTMPYRLFLPPDPEPDREYPLVLFLHGLGESGTDNISQVTHNINDLIAATQSERFKSYLVAPQVPWGTDWTMVGSINLVAGILDEVEAGYSVDERRIYVTGLSLGGFGTLAQLYSFPERYVAGVPIASGTSAAQAPAIAAVIKDIPIWVFHGSADTVVSVELSRNIVQALRDAGGTPLYTEYPGVGHNSWTPAYADANDELYPWLFSQVLGGPRARFSVSPESGSVPLEVCFDAAESTAGEDGALTRFEWQFGDGNSAEGISPCHTYMEAGVYDVTLRVTTDAGSSAESPATIVAHCSPEDVGPWSLDDIGDPVFHGGARLEDGGTTLAICGGGKVLSGISDSIQFVNRQISRDATCTIRITALESPSTSAQAGIMFRESLAPRARCACLTLRIGTSGYIFFQLRSTPGAGLTVRGTTRSPTGIPDVWLRLAKQGDEFIAFASTEGDTWEELGRRTLPDFPETFHAGIVAAGGDPLRLQPFDALRTEIQDLDLSIAPPGGRQIPGDCNQDKALDLSDAVCLLGNLFLGAPAQLPCGQRTASDPANLTLLDSNGDQALDLSDVVSVLGFLFLGDPPPVLGTDCVPIVGCPNVCES